jgi:ribonuclease VapC
MPISLSQAGLGHRTMQAFGRGVDPVGLNFGDCPVFGLAKETREPLLFKGGDFAQTDVEPALKD